MRQRRVLSAFLAIVMVLTIAFGSMPAFAAEETPDEVGVPLDGVGEVFEEEKLPDEAEAALEGEEETPEEVVPDEFDVLREKWQYLATGGDYHPENEDMQGLLTSINDVAQDLLERINPAPTPDWGANDYLWLEYPLGKHNDAYSDSNNVQFSIRSLKFMALAYQTNGCDLFKNEKLKTEILRGIAYIHDEHFEPGVVDNQYGNWFTWQIGGPIYFCELLLLMYDELTPEQVEAYATTARKGGADPTGTSYEYVGANALWRDRVRMYTGILLKDSELLDYVKNDAPKFMGYVTSGDGYYEDGTFMQHGDVTYNGGYGKEAFTDVVHFLYMLDGSSWEITGEERDNYAHIVETTYVPFMYNGVFMDMVRGREITRTDTTDAYAGITISLDVLLLSEILPKDEGDRLKGMVKAWMDNDYALETLNDGAGVAWYLFPVYNLSKTLEVLGDDSIEPVTNTGTSYTFGKGTRVVHATDKFTLGLSMYSKDIANYEVGDSNAKGWYTGLGMTYLYTPDIGRYTLQKPTIDWNRLPGVTAVNGVKPGKHTNSSGFGGSTTLQDTYSTAGMTLPSATTKVSAKKSWFMFDDEVVALGSGISSTHANKVETTIDNLMMTGENALIINGESQPTELGWSGKIENAKWALIEGNVAGSNTGVYFPQETTLSALRETRTGKWTDLGSYNVDETEQLADYLTMWIDHGAKPVDDSYAYVLLPGATEAQVENYASSSDIEILRQDSNVHAVYEKTLNTLGANFWTDSYESIDAMGVDNYLSVDKAASVMVKEDDNKLSFALSDSTKRNLENPITVIINRESTGVITKDSRIKVIQTKPFIKLEVNAKGSFGNPIEAEFSYKSLDLPGSTSIKRMTLVDDTLRLEFAEAQRASSYQVVYGTESKVYTDKLAAPGTSVEIKGLSAETTYYFAVQAMNETGAGPLSEEKVYAIGDTRTLVDEYEDFSKVVSYSGGWAFDAGNPANFNGDTTRIKRDETKGGKKRMEYVTYYAPSPKDFTFTVYDYSMTKPEEQTVLKIFGSPDNETWTELKTNSVLTPTLDQWKKVVYTNDGVMDPTIQFIKIEVSQNAKGWAPQLSRMEINYAWTSNRVVRDTMLNDSTAYEVTGDVAYVTGDGTSFGGDTDVLVKNDAEDVTMLYSYTNLKKAELTAFRAKESDGTVTFASSKDGKTFAAVLSGPQVLEGDYGSYDKVVYSIPALEQGTNYLRITVSGGADSIALSDLTFSYNHQVAPIDKIRFQDAKLEVVMDYPLTPAVKVAPMNATGEIKYTISDKDIVTVNASTGILEAQGFGKAVLTATVTGVGGNVTATIPVRTSENRALKAAATASSARSGYAAGSATDGNYLTRWESNGGNAQSLQVDLALSGEFKAIELNWQQYATKYEVQGSRNGTDWVTLFTEENGKGGDVWIEFDEVQNYRYVRVIGTESPGNYSLWELRVLAFEAKSGTEPVNLAIGKTATTSGNDSSNSDPQAAIDGNTGTRWASARKEGQWFTIDLGASRKIYQINLLWEASYGKEYDILVSDDSTFAVAKTVVSERNGAKDWKYHILSEPVEGRYVRMQGILRGNTKYGYSIYEFEVMGDAEKTDIKAIKFASDKLTVLKDQKKTATIVTDPTQVDEGSVAFTSTDPKVATVTNKGVVTGVSIGTTTITVASVADPSVTASCEVTVTDYNGAPIPVENLEVVGGVTLLANGTTAQLSATIKPDDASIPNVYWTSSNENVLLVTNEGLLKGIALGTSIIRGTSVANPEFKYEQQIRVYDPEVESVRVLIEAIGTVNLSSKPDIDAARAAYEDLSAEKKALVDNYDVLTAAETRFPELQQEIDAAKTLISAIGTVTLGSKPAIDAARAAYTVLTDEQKAMVDNYAELTAAETKFAELAAVEVAPVEALITAIGSMITLDSKNAIDAARTAYNDLPDDQKPYVNNYESLTTAETRYATLLEEIDDAKALISAIDSTITLSSKSAIDAARTAYTALTSEQQARVDNYNVLTTAETRYATLLEEIDTAKALITAIGSVTPGSKSAIDAARAAYTALTDEQQALVDNYEALTTAETQYATLLEEIDTAKALITAIGTVTPGSKSAIDAARAAYTALTPEQKALVENYEVLATAEARYATLLEEIDTAERLITAIGTVTPSSKAAIDAARAAYTALTDEQKVLVENYEVLTNAETRYAMLLEEIDTAKSLITAIGTVTPGSKDAIDVARAAYDALTPEQKALVENYEVLTIAETQYAELLGEVEVVKMLIDAIGTVTLESKDNIAAARTAYDKLTTEQKALVENYEALTTAEAQYAALANVSGVRLNKDAVDLTPGDKEQLTATVTPDTALNKNITWTSDKPEIATVDENGLVTAVKDGKAVITVTTEDGEYAAACTVTVETYQPSYNPPSNTTTKTEKNEDGSTTKTMTNKKTGNVTETTTYPDGTKIVATTPKDGETSIEVTVPKDKETVIVTIPTSEQPKPGEVAVIIKEDGTKEILKRSVATEAGLKVLLSESCTLEIVDNSKSFADVASDHWAAEAVQFVASRELFNGGDSGFLPAGDMSRAMLFTVLARLDGQETEGGSSWYSAAMDWAKEAGISDGTNAESSITREQLAAMLYRYAGSPEVDESRRDEVIAPYTDAGSVSDWATDAMLWCVDSGILQGSDSKLNPNGTATRAEVAVMLQRFISNMA